MQYHRRGVIDLYELLRDAPETLAGATIADKVVGRGAAALMVLGKIKRLHTGVLRSSLHSNFCNVQA